MVRVNKVKRKSKRRSRRRSSKKRSVSRRRRSSKKRVSRRRSSKKRVSRRRSSKKRVLRRRSRTRSKQRGGVQKEKRKRECGIGEREFWRDVRQLMPGGVLYDITAIVNADSETTGRLMKTHTIDLHTELGMVRTKPRRAATPEANATLERTWDPTQWEETLEKVAAATQKTEAQLVEFGEARASIPAELQPHTDDILRDNWVAAAVTSVRTNTWGLIGSIMTNLHRVAATAAAARAAAVSKAKLAAASVGASAVSKAKLAAASVGAMAVGPGSTPGSRLRLLLGTIMSYAILSRTGKILDVLPSLEDLQYLDSELARSLTSGAPSLTSGGPGFERSGVALVATAATVSSVVGSVYTDICDTLRKLYNIAHAATDVVGDTVESTGKSFSIARAQEVRCIADALGELNVKRTRIRASDAGAAAASSAASSAEEATSIVRQLQQDGASEFHTGDYAVEGGGGGGGGDGVADGH
jgi:hypothetical protein